MSCVSVVMGAVHSLVVLKSLQLLQQSVVYEFMSGIRLKNIVDYKLFFNLSSYSNVLN